MVSPTQREAVAGILGPVLPMADGIKTAPSMDYTPEFTNG